MAFNRWNCSCLFHHWVKAKESKLEKQRTFVTEFAEAELKRKSTANANLLSICGDVFSSFLTKQIPNFLFLTVPDTFSNCMLCWPLLLTTTQRHSCQFSSVACHYTDLDKFACIQVTQQWPGGSLRFWTGGQLSLTPGLLARPGGPSPPRGVRGMLPRKILKLYSCRDVFSCILKLQTVTFNNQKKITFLDNLVMIWYQEFSLEGESQKY